MCLMLILIALKELIPAIKLVDSDSRKDLITVVALEGCLVAVAANSGGVRIKIILRLSVIILCALENVDAL